MMLELSMIYEWIWSIKNLLYRSGYVGTNHGSYSKNCPDIEVEVVDINETRIKAWNDADLNNLPVFEPGLSEIVRMLETKILLFR